MEENKRNKAIRIINENRSADFRAQLTFQEIANECGLSSSQVCDIYFRIVTRAPTTPAEADAMDMKHIRHGQA